MLYQTDEMSTEVMENAANAAAKRREQRRRRILMNPEERMNRLTGYSQSGLGDPPKSNQDTLILNGVNVPLDQHSTTPGENITQPQEVGKDDRPVSTSSTFLADRGCQSTLLGSSQQSNHPRTAQTRAEGHSTVATFTRVRYVLSFLLGVIVRISMLFPFGQQFVQSIVNPYIAFEIAMFGYQQAVGMDVGASVQGGLWLSTLLLTGIKQDVIESYKYIMGLLTAAADDFTLFFFAFVAVHLVCLVFV